MELDRRRFLIIGGVTALALAVKPALDVLPRSKASQAPTAAPKVAKRWAMAVKTGVCPNGCTACIAACNSAHNIPDFGNAKDEIKWIWEEPFEAAFPEQENVLKKGLKDVPVTLLCNHCDHPPCVRVCPTKATFKREDGIVMIDYHRCIGCRYCMAACPYGSRSFNWRDPRPFIKEINPDFPTRTKGVVEKCNFCEERLAQGLMPACVDACPAKALVFGDLEDPQSEISTLLAAQYSIQRKPELGTRPQVYYIV